MDAARVMMEVPTISIVIPAYQAAATIGRAIRSLQDQRYPKLEVLVMDGGSTDNTLEILAEFESWLTVLVSEPDQGQADALNKGFRMASGEIFGWLCADDILLPGALHAVATVFQEDPETDWVAGGCEMRYPNEPGKNFVFHPREDFVAHLPGFNGVMQPSVFWRSAAVSRSPVVDASYHYAMDAELWCYLASLGCKAGVIPGVLSAFIQDGGNKTATGGRAIGLELDRCYRKYAKDRIPLSFWYRHFRYPFECTLRRDRGILRRLILGGFQIMWMCVLAPFYGWKKVRLMSWPA